MGNNESFISKVLTTIIAGLAIFIISQIYTDIYKQPLIGIDLESLGIENSNLINKITLKNGGHNSANNFRLTINTDAMIQNFSKVFFVENFSTPVIENSQFLTTSAPRLTVGSILVLDTIIKPLKNNTKYNIFVTYDQGSTNTSYILNTKNQAIVANEPKNFYDMIWESAAVLNSSYAIIIVIIITIVLKILGYIRQRTRVYTKKNST